MIRLAACGFAALMLLGSSRAEAQSTLGAGALHGTVLDASGAVVGGARVTLTETSKGWVRTSESGRDGSFLFASVIDGLYTIGVDKPGFNTEKVGGLRIEVGQQAAVTIRLRPAGTQTSITVQAPTST